MISTRFVSLASAWMALVGLASNTARADALAEAKSAFEAWHYKCESFPSQEAINAVRAASDQDADAKYWWSLSLLRENRFTASEEDKSIYYRQIAEAAHSGSLKASALTAYLAFHTVGPDVAHNQKEVLLSALSEIAKKSNTDAMLYLGQIFRDGTGGVQIDYDKSIKLFNLAISLGNCRGYFELGKSYEGKSDFKPAIAAYEKAAEVGDAEAQVVLSDMLSTGRLLQKNPERSKKLLEDASEKGYPPALSKLAAIEIQNGELAKGWKPLRLAMLSGFPTAIKQAAEIGLRGYKIPLEDLTVLTDHLTRLASRDDAQAQAYLGALMLTGIVQEPKPGDGKALLHKSKSLGNRDADIWINLLKL